MSLATQILLSECKPNIFWLNITITNNCKDEIRQLKFRLKVYLIYANSDYYRCLKKIYLLSRIESHFFKCLYS